MRTLRKTVAVMLLLSFTYSLLAVFPPVVHAATNPVTITVDKFESGKLDFHWDSIPNISTVVTYHTPDADGVSSILNTLNPTTNNASITGLTSDYVYDIDVQIFDASSATVPVGHGLLYYIPKISFYASTPGLAYTDIAGGGREVGGNPKLQLRWILPKAYCKSDNKYRDANDATVLTEMQNALNAIYGDGHSISRLDFRINISSDYNLLNSGGSQAAVLIKDAGTKYTAQVAGGTAVADVSDTAVPNYQSITLLGRSDSTASLPTPGSAFELPHGDIYPGTVYYMNIKPVYVDTSDKSVIMVGNQDDHNGSVLSGAQKYAYTSIRFQLTKDSANNIYVKIYKINQGSLDLPRLYYQVQSSDDPSAPGDWSVKKTMDDTYFSGNFAVSVISGVNINNEIYYKVVVKSDSPTDRLESSKMPYTLSVDTSRPPIPMNITVIRREMAYTTVAGIQTKTTDVTFQWDKPVNWDAMKAEATSGNAIDFYFAINTAQTESMASPYPPLETEGKFEGNYPLRYRVVSYVNARNTTGGGITEVGSKLQYTLKGADLFKGAFWDGTLDGSGNPVITPDDFKAAVNSENYPDWLLSNKIYYLEMFSAKDSDRPAILANANYFSEDSDKMSDRSIIVSFTTLTSTDMDVPLPAGFKTDVNNVITNSDPAPAPTKVNNIELLFDKVTIRDWSNYTTHHDTNDKVYYDVYMNTRTDTNFVLIGSTQNTTGVAFTGADDSMSGSIRATVNHFTNDTSVTGDPYDVFGPNLLPNTTYYFYVQTRLVMVNETKDKTSMNTIILPVTTVNIVITPPDDSQRKPLAPTDFAIALDADGNQKVSGYSVTFNWLRQETDVRYELIATTEKVLPNDTSGTYSGDPIYQSFVTSFDLKADNTTDGAIFLDPSNNPLVDPTHFTYDPATKLCTYKIDTWLFPNKLYYFSLRAVRKTVGTQSVWVSIPVTTSLIEPPQGLEVVSDAQLGFFWQDPDPLLVADDFRIFMKGPSDADYKLITRTQSTILKDKDQKTYYGRIMGLKLNSSYSVRVVKGNGTGTIVFDKRDMTTRDGYHELMVRWKGLPADGKFSGFQLAVRSEDGTDYTTLTSADMQPAFDKDGQLLPYYTEETPQTINNNQIYYYALLQKSEVTLAGGLVVHQALRSNMKYYIKVRTWQLDPAELQATAYSKYIGPVSTRTEFSQSDYDDTDRDEQEEALFMDRVKELEKGLYWRLAVNNSAACKVFLKSSLIASALLSSKDDRVVVDISEINLNIDTDIVYVPANVLQTLNNVNKNLVLRTAGAEYMFRPRTVDMETDQQVKTLQGKAGVKEVYVALKINRAQTTTGLPAGLQTVSKVNDLEMQAVPTTRSEKELAELVHDKLYNKSTGLVPAKLNILTNTYIGTGTEANKILDEYISQLIKMLEADLSNYLDTTVESAKISGSILSITTFDTPMSAKLSNSNVQGYKSPYVLYDGSQTWQKLTTNVASADGAVQFNPSKSGKYVILVAQTSVGDVSTDHWASPAISKLMNKYDLSDVFPGVNAAFGPDNIVTGKEMVLLFEKVTGRTAENTGLDIKQKVKKLKLDKVINANTVMKNITRQEAAGILAELYAVKKSLDASSLRPSGSIYINDEAKIDEDIYNSVVIVIDKHIMSLDANGNFNPTGGLSRAEAAVTLVRLLEQTGDL